MVYKIDFLSKMVGLGPNDRGIHALHIRTGQNSLDSYFWPVLICRGVPGILTAAFPARKAIKQTENGHITKWPFWACFIGFFAQATLLYNLGYTPFQKLAVISLSMGYGQYLVHCKTPKINVDL